MVREIVVYLLLFIFALAAYVWTKRHGGSREKRLPGLTTPGWMSSVSGWLQQSGLSGTGTSSANRYGYPNEEALAKALETQVTTVLDELYQEFCEETKRVRVDAAVAVETLQSELMNEIIDLRDELQALRSRLETQEVPHETATQSMQESQAGRQLLGSQAGGATTFDPVYFQIYDELQAGKSQMEIALQLGVGVEVVRLVERVMSNAQLT